MGLQDWQVFTMLKGNTKAQRITVALPTESILITVESNWIQMLLRREVSFVNRKQDKQDVRDKRGPKAEARGSKFRKPRTLDLEPSSVPLISPFSLVLRALRIGCDAREVREMRKGATLDSFD